MTTVNYRRVNIGSLNRASALCLLALAAALLLPGEAQAQWTSPNAQGNINNTNTGNVGVGTTTPSSQLHISSSSTAVSRGIVNEQTSADANSSLFTFSKSRAGGAVVNGDNIGNLFTAASDGTTMISPARLRFAVDGPVSANSVPTSIQFHTGVNGNGGLERMRISSGGNVGVGTAAPSYKFEVAGSTSRNTLALTGDGDSVGYAGIKIQALTTTGIATNRASQYNLHMRKDSWYSGDASGPSFIIETVSTAGGYAAPFMITPNNNVILNGGRGAHSLSYGNVGIGTTAPVSKLHVAGDITVDGNINAKYQDVAEWVPSKQKLNAGTVVILDVERDNHVAASATAYDTRVAGVISAQPGISLGEKGEGKVLVATTGRVKVRVDATRGAIKVGDLLVTSEVAGVAMKSQPLDLGGVAIHRPGTLIGKALESLEKGTGEILVLLSLQ